MDEKTGGTSKGNGCAIVATASIDNLRAAME